MTGTRPGLRSLTEVRTRLGRRWYEWRSAAARSAAVESLTAAVRELPEHPGLPAPSGWSVLRVVPTETDMTVVVFAAAGRPVAVGRIGGADPQERQLLRNAAVLDRLWADPRLAALVPFLPLPLAAGEREGRPYAVERAVAGTPASARLRSPATAGAVVEVAASAIDVLHRATAVPRTVDDELLDRWVGEPLRVLRAALPGTAAGRPAALDRLEAELRSALAGRPASTSWTHGDYWCGNVLLADEPSSPPRLSGIVDWDAAAPDGLPLVDVHHLVLTTRALVARTDVGLVVARELRCSSGGTPEEQRLLEASAWSLPGGSRRAGVLLAWLGHVAAVLGKTARQPAGARWVARNVDALLAELG